MPLSLSGRLDRSGLTGSWPGTASAAGFRGLSVVGAPDAGGDCGQCVEPLRCDGITATPAGAVGSGSQPLLGRVHGTQFGASLFKQACHLGTFERDSDAFRVVLVVVGRVGRGLDDPIEAAAQRLDQIECLPAADRQSAGQVGHTVIGTPTA